MTSHAVPSPDLNRNPSHLVPSPDLNGNRGTPVSLRFGVNGGLGMLKAMSYSSSYYARVRRLSTTVIVDRRVAGLAFGLRLGIGLGLGFGLGLRFEAP